MARDEVKIKVRPQKVGDEPEALEKQLSKLKNSKLQVEIDAKKDRLKEIEAEIESLEQDLEVAHTFGVDDSQVDELESQIQALKETQAQLVVDVDDAQLLQAKELEESLNGEADFKVNLLSQIADSSDFMNMGQGFTQAKQGAQELLSGLGEIQQAGAQTQQNLKFLELNEAKLNGRQAVDVYKEISDIVASMPGDDNTMRSVLSTAQALGNNLNPNEMRAAAVTMADYMSGSATMGKQALESQQDIMKYLLDGNTAELERGSIVSSQVDKLKDATTFQERQVAMQEVLNELGYGGISQTDTLLNKQAEWEGMMYNAKDILSSMWIPFEQQGMDAFIKLDEKMGHIPAMGLAIAEVAGGPIIDLALGLGQIGTGLDGLMRGFDILKNSRIADFFGNLKTKVLDVASTIKTTFVEALTSVKATITETVIPKITELATSIKTTLLNAFQSFANFMRTSVIPALKNLAISLIEAGKQALISGYNALKSAALWAYQKLALIASTIAEYGLAAAQAVLNFVMSLNPIVLVVMALIALVAALLWAYNNVDWFREAIDNLFGFIQEGVTNAINTAVSMINWGISVITSTLQALWNYIVTLGGLIPANASITGNKVVDTILKVMAFFATLPIQIGIIFVNIIAKALGFGDNFFQNMVNGAAKTVSTFIGKIRELPGMIQAEFARIESIVSNFVTSLPQRVWDLGASIVSALKGALGIGSPGYMFYMVEGEFKRIDNLTDDTYFNTGKLGEAMVNDFYNSLKNSSDLLTANLSAKAELSESFKLETENNDNKGLYDLVNSFKSLFENFSKSFDSTNQITTNNQVSTTNLNKNVTSSLETSNESLTNITNNINLTIGSVDDEKRVEEIVNAVKRSISWNNKTAGRTL